MNIKKTITQVGAVGGSVASLAQLTHMASLGWNVPYTAFSFLSILLGVTAVSTYSLLQDTKEEKAKEELEASKKLVQLINASHGKTTLAELMVHMDMPIPALKAKLDKMQKDGLLGTSTYSLLEDAKKEHALANLQQTRYLLQIAASNYGKVYLSDLVMKIDMPLPELRAKLDEMQKDGLLGVEVSNAGEVLYIVSNQFTLEDRLDSHKLIN
jgi:hypothetical protein